MSRAGTSQSMNIERVTITKQRPELSAQKWADRSITADAARSLDLAQSGRKGKATHKSECLIV